MTEEILDMLEEARKEIADLKVAVQFLLAFIGDGSVLSTAGQMEKYSRLLARFEVNT